VTRIVAIIFLFVSFIGFLDSAYLTATHYSGVLAPCIIVHGCDTVTTSSYSQIGGIPVALLGALYYLCVFLLILAFLDTKKRIFFVVARILTLVGFLFSLWFLYVQAALLHAYCIYCLGSLTTSTILFTGTLVIFFQKKKMSREHLEESA